MKCTTASNKSLCDKFGLKTLEFDKEMDSLFQDYVRAGNKCMEYPKDRGPYTDSSYEEFVATFQAEYRNMQGGVEGNFEMEAGET